MWVEWVKTGHNNRQLGSFIDSLKTKFSKPRKMNK
jgi:hypothetical protein